MKRNLLFATLFIFCLSAWTTQAQTVLGQSNALNFDGTDDYVEVPDDASLDFANTGTYTLEAWIYKEAENAVNTAAHILHKGEIGNQNYVLGVAGSNAGSDADKVFFTSGTINYGSTQLSHNTWHHIAVTYNNGSFKIYVNAVQENAGTITGGTPSNNPLRICWSGINLADNRSLNGKVDEIRIWNVERSANEIMASYRGELCGGETGLAAYWDFNQGIAGGSNGGISTLEDKTSNNNDGTLTGFAKTGCEGNFCYSSAIQKNGLDFVGSETVGDYVEIAHNAAFDVTSLTIEAWVKPEDTGGQTWSRIFSSSSDNNFEITQRSNGNNRFGVYTNGAADFVVNSTNWTAGTWYHVAAVWDNTNLELFVDGTSVGSTAATTPTSNNNRFIGSKSTSNSHYFNGQIDEVRIWSVARTQMQISDNMNSEITSNTSDLIAYYKFNQGEAGQTNTQVTTLEDLSENCLDGTLTGFALTGSTGNWVSSTSWYSSCTAPSGMAASNITTTTADISWTENGSASTWDLEWKAGNDFTPGTGAQDASATVCTTTSYSFSGLTAGTTYYVHYRSDCGINQSSWVGAYTFTTSAVSVPTVLGECNGLDFDGTDDYVSIPDNGTLDFASSSTFTLETWVYWKGQNNNGDGSCVFFDKTETHPNANYRFFVIEPGAGIHANKIGFWNGTSNVRSTGTVPTNTWTHVALVYDNTTYTFYINGAASGTGTHAAGAVNNGAVFLGKDNSPGREMNGALDEMRIWNVARSATDIMASYRGELCGGENNMVLYCDFNQGTAGGDNSGITTVDDKTTSNNDGTLVNFTKTGSTSNFVTSGAIQKNGLDFDGTDDYVDCGDIDGLDNASTFTIEVWAKYTTPVSTAEFVSKHFNTSNNIRLFANATQIYMHVEHNTATAHGFVNYTNNGDWNHYAMVFDGTLSGNSNRLKLYINGVQQTLSFNGTIPATTDDNSGVVKLGESQGASFLNGSLDEVRIWSTARSSGEISSNMNSEITGTTSDLIAYYKLNQGDANGTNTNVTTAVDLSSNCHHGTLNSFALTGSSSNWGSSASVFPVELTYFRAQPIDESSLLTWETATETNNEGFEIQWAASSQQLENGNWERIGFVAGAGNSFEARSYQFVHKNPVKGTNYYRLKQIDYDGDFTFSHVASVDLLNLQNLVNLRVVPNPVQNDEFTLYLPEFETEATSLEIYDYTGKLLQQQILYDKKNTIDVGQLQSGIYLIKVEINGQHLVERIIVQ